MGSSMGGEGEAGVGEDYWGVRRVGVMTNDNGTNDKGNPKSEKTPTRTVASLRRLLLPLRDRVQSGN